MTDTTATVDYTVALNDDSNVTLNVYPTGTTTGSVGSEVITATGSFNLTGLTTETGYDVVVTSTLITTPTVLHTFTTDVSPVRMVREQLENLSKDELLTHAKQLGIKVDARSKEDKIIEKLISEE